MFVGREELEIAGLGDPGASLSKSGVDFGVAGIRIGMLLKAEGEDGVFEGSGAVEAPLVLGDGLSEIGFEGSDGF